MTFLTAAGGDVSAVQAGLVAQLFPLFMVLVAFISSWCVPAATAKTAGEDAISPKARG